MRKHPLNEEVGAEDEAGVGVEFGGRDVELEDNGTRGDGAGG